MDECYALKVWIVLVGHDNSNSILRCMVLTCLGCNGA